MSPPRASLCELITDSLFYPILDYDYCVGYDLEPADLPARWHALGLTYYQLRFKGSSPDQYLRLARELKKHAPGPALIANDHLNVALDNPDVFQGIHLGQEDFAALTGEERDRLAEASRKSPLAGISTHNPGQFQAAAKGGIAWAYIALGPMAATESKPAGTDPVIPEDEKLQIFEEFVKIFNDRRKPGLVLIGGLTAGTLDTILPRDFRSRYGFMTIIASISAAARPDTLREILEELRKYNA